MAKTCIPQCELALLPHTLPSPHNPTCPFLTLRLRFLINPEKGVLTLSLKKSFSPTLVLTILASIFYIVLPSPRDWHKQFTQIVQTSKKSKSNCKPTCS